MYTYQYGDPPEAMMKTTKRHEVGATTMRTFILDLLAHSERGCLPFAAVKQAVYDRFSPSFSKYDLRRMKGRKVAKWENNLAWAQAHAQRLGEFATITASRRKVIVNLTPGLPMPPIELLVLALRKRPGHMFKKKCPDCGVYHPLVEEHCECGHVFDPPLPRL